MTTAPEGITLFGSATDSTVGIPLSESSDMANILQSGSRETLGVCLYLILVQDLSNSEILQLQPPRGFENHNFSLLWRRKGGLRTGHPPAYHRRRSETSGVQACARTA